MRRLFCCLVVFFFLGGCGSSIEPMDKALALRSKLQQSEGCEFVAVVTADYFDKVQSFALQCTGDTSGNITFQVLEPSSVAGISGRIDSRGGKLTFDEQALLFSLMAETRISPVGAPWILLQALRAGYIRGCSDADGVLTIHIDDTFGDDALQLIVRTNSENVLVSAEIFHQERRILTVQIEQFVYL